jgi:hypothetical protein
MHLAQSSSAFIFCVSAALIVALALAGCSSKEKSQVINSGPGGITIQYDTRYPTMTGVDADEHCAKFGKVAVRVETKKVSSMESVTEPYAAQAVYACEASN